MQDSDTARAQPIDPVVIRFTRQIFYDDQTVYQAEVRASPLLLRSGPLRVDIDPQIDRFRLLFAQRIAVEHAYAESPADVDPEAAKESRDLINLGEALYLFLPTGLREGLLTVLQRAFDSKHRLELIFEVRAGDKADQLLSLPWEIMYLPTIKQHLGLIERVTITRRLLETVRRTRPRLEPPFQIAHVIASVAMADPIDPKLQALEADVLRKVAGRDELYTLVSNPGSVERLLEELRRRHHQIVHFLGHGDVDTGESQQSYLLFAGEDDTPQLVSCEQLPRLLSESPGTQIMVLNACHGASAVAANTVAMQLVYYGIPYVVAMQGKVFQKAAAVFARVFYTSLQNDVSLAEAVARSRRAIAAELPGAIDWCLPALYVSAGTGEGRPDVRVVNSIERWLSQPAGQRQIGAISIGLGVAHLCVTCLLLLSGVALPPPELGLLLPVVGALGLAPLLLAIAARWFGDIPEPNKPSLRWPLMLRIFSATALGLGLPAVYAWFTLLLVVGMGFWAILAPSARLVLLALLFVPGLLVSWQQAHGHAHGLLTNANIASPSLDLTELVVSFAGYLMLCGPLVLLWLAPQMTAPPWGNLAAGFFLCALGYVVRKDVKTTIL